MVLSDTVAIRSYFRGGAVYALPNAVQIAQGIESAVKGHTVLAQDVRRLGRHLSAAWEDDFRGLRSRLRRIGTGAPRSFGRTKGPIMIRVDSAVEAELPVLSWIASLERRQSVVRILRGKGCDYVSGRMVLEGTWSGGDLDGDLPCDRELNCSTGIAVRGDRVWCWTPAHPFDKLFVVHVDQKVLVSNSLIAMMSVMRDAPDPNCTNYHDRLTDDKDGVSGPRPPLPTRDGRSIQVYVAAVLTIDNDLLLERKPRAQLPSAVSYEDHIRYLESACLDLVSNARLPWRSMPLRPVTTVSSGFDSTAVSVLAKAAGCDSAVALVDARRSFADMDDGRPIAESLKLSVFSAKRTDYRSMPGYPEALFLASGVGGEDVVLAPFEEQFRGALLFTGIGGDQVWGLEARDPSASLDFKGRNVAGASLQEYRLSIGFGHVPLPKMLCPIHPDLDRISRSPEMAAWHSGTRGYIRPIPTRIAMEAGIRREMFGLTKKAVTQPFYHNLELSDLLTERSQVSFREFIKSMPSTSAGFGARLFLRLMRSGAVGYLERILVYVTRRPVELASVVPVRIVALATGYAYCFHWAHAQCRRTVSQAGRAHLGLSE